MPNCSCSNSIDAFQNALEHLSSKVSFLDEKLLEKVNFQVQIGKKLDVLQQLKDCVKNEEENAEILDDCCNALGNQLEAFKGHFLVLEAQVDTNERVPQCSPAGSGTPDQGKLLHPVERPCKYTEDDVFGPPDSSSEEGSPVTSFVKGNPLSKKLLTLPIKHSCDGGNVTTADDDMMTAFPRKSRLKRPKATKKAMQVDPVRYFSTKNWRLVPVDQDLPWMIRKLSSNGKSENFVSLQQFQTPELSNTTTNN